MQVCFRPFTRLTLPTVDLSRLNEAEREAIDATLANAALEQPFDLDTGPMVRLDVIRHSDQKHSVLCVLHHIVSDGWSRGVLIREVSALYQAFGRGEPSPLPELKIQYGDYAVWQRERLKGETLERELTFWKEQLSGAPLLLDLPTDRPRPPIQTYRGAAETLALSPELSQQLKALSQQHGTTMFMLLLAAFQTLLHRYTNEDDVVVGTTIANRERSELEPLIGFFVNMVALRTDCSGNPSFLTLLDQVRKTTLQAYAHQTAPFEELVRALRPKRNLGYLPLFQAVFSFHNQPTLTEMELSGLTLSVPRREVTTSQIDLLLDMFESNDGLQGAVQYNADLFDRRTILQLMAHFENLLAAVATDPEQRLLDLALLSPAETEEIEVWNHTQTASLPETCVHDLIAAQVKATPNAIAASFRGDLLSYGELNRRANQVARYLHAEGVKPGDLVGVCLEHSLEELIALLGVLKSGAGYVALDPEHPPQRIEFALSDANVATNLTQEKLAADWPIIAAQPDSDPGVEVSPDSLAYVIYTSGSTGQPKGAGISHRSLVNYISWAKDVYLRGDNLAFALYSSLAFDLTVTSIYVPLITGNKVAIFRRDAKDALLEEIIADGQVGVCKLTPSHLTLIKDVDNRKSSVKRLIVGGEALGTELTRQVVESFGGDVEVFNEYGPTEATVGCMIYQFDPVNDVRANVPIGRPAANVNLYVLDKSLQPVPTNVTGELFIASPGLAQGYLARPALRPNGSFRIPIRPDSACIAPATCAAVYRRAISNTSAARTNRSSFTVIASRRTRFATP